MSKVTIRERKQKTHISYVLDIYTGNDKKRVRETLNFHGILNPKDKTERGFNKEQLRKANAIAAQREKELVNMEYGLPTPKLNSSFINYAELYTKKRAGHGTSFEKVEAMLKHLKRFMEGKDPSFREINELWVEDFKNYLQHQAVKKDGKKLSPNTASLYLRKLKRLLHQALREGIILKNPASYVDNIKNVKTEREFLEISELKKLIKSEDWKYSTIKRAFIFGCYTGFRLGDIINLTWDKIKKSEEKGWYIPVKMQKTNDYHKIYVADHVIELLGDPGSPKEKVFEGLKSGDAPRIKTWIKEVGIDKNITFHCSRHTNACLLLEGGADLYTVSKVLGHKNIQTTEIYLHYLDSKMHEAANLIPNLFS